MNELKETIQLMLSSDYKDRFIAEYWQLRIRYTKLSKMIKDWERGELDFTPTCPKDIYDRQLQSMSMYLNVLEVRAKLENIDVEMYNKKEELLYEAKEKEILETKRLRKKLDEALQEIKKLNQTEGISLSIIKVKEAIMWLGIHLKELDSEDPYPTSKNDTDLTIHPVADNLKF